MTNYFPLFDPIPPFLKPAINWSQFSPHSSFESAFGVRGMRAFWCSRKNESFFFLNLNIVKTEAYFKSQSQWASSICTLQPACGCHLPAVSDSPGAFVFAASPEWSLSQVHLFNRERVSGSGSVVNSQKSSLSGRPFPDLGGLLLPGHPLSTLAQYF